MSGPFGNPAMVSSGGGGGGPHIIGALEMGTKGSNPARWSLNGSGLGFPNYQSFKTDFESRSGMGFGYNAYPDVVTISFWMKGYNSADWSGPGNQSVPPTPSYNVCTILSTEFGSRDSNFEISGSATAGYSLAVPIFRSRNWYMGREVPPANTFQDTNVNGEAAGWDHFMVTFDWKAGVASYMDAMKVWINGTAMTQNVNASPYYSGINDYLRMPISWGAARDPSYGIGLNYLSYMQSFDTSGLNGKPGSLAAFFCPYASFTNGYHGLIANLQVFPWSVAPTDLGYNNGGVWSSIPYTGSFRQNAGYTLDYLPTSSSIAVATYNQIGELWAASYDFSDPLDKMKDQSGNGFDFFPNFQTGSYIQHVTHDLPPM